MRLVTLSLGVVVFFSLIGCEQPQGGRRAIAQDYSLYDAEDGSINRGLSLAEHLSTRRPIEIAVVWNSAAGVDEFWQGARLAAEEINALPDTHYPKLQINEYDAAPFLEQFHFSRSREGKFRNASQLAAGALAETVLENPNNVAVVGHAYLDDTAANALLSYEKAGILFFSSTTTNSRISGMRSPLAFELFPSAAAISERSAKFALDAGIEKVIVIQQRGMYGSSADPVPTFLKHLAENGINKTDIFSFTSGRTSSTATAARVTEELVKRIKGQPDSVGLFLLVENDLALTIFQQLAMLKMTPPMLAASRLDSYEQSVIEMYPGFTFLDIFAPDRSLDAKRFEIKFRKRFGESHASNYAALGYDHIRFLYQTFLCADSTDPGTVALNIQYHQPIWHGVTGSLNFSQSHQNQAMSSVILRQFKEINGQLAIVTLDR
jgi:ABC-type branched-subunit amino acid transport system substrate-binding protein